MDNYQSAPLVANETLRCEILTSVFLGQIVMPHPQKVGFVSLGCPKALVDSERILTQLRFDGYEVSPSYEDAGLVIVNNCGII